MEDRCPGTLNCGSASHGAAALIRSSNSDLSGLLPKQDGINTEIAIFGPVLALVLKAGKTAVSREFGGCFYIPMIIKCASLLAAIAIR
ncbi:hypothetical protein GGE65_007865 [Skermanella aerolata]